MAKVNTGITQGFRSIRLLFSAILLLQLTLLSLAAQENSGGTDEETSLFIPVDGVENWSQEIDVTDLAPGTYNYIVESTDEAGNKTLSDPINIYVDPESDKPEVGISNPDAGMAVAGRLNIIGTASDDDGVARVEIKINDGSYFPAGGTEFWSYLLDTSALEDGPCLLTARSTDINGIRSDETSVRFILDRTIPRNEILSHGNGDMVHGKIRIEGNSVDGNGIESIQWGLDGVSYEELSWKQSKKDPFAVFDFSLDTKELEDGAQVVWIKSTDKTGSVGVAPLLLFVDNHPPVLEILYPKEEDRVDGRFAVVGTVQDDIGLASLVYVTGKGDPVEIPLAAGDPYWVAPFELSGSKKGDIRFILTDLTGNEAELRLQMEFDLEADKPVVEPIFPVVDGPNENPRFAGFVHDDDGPVKVDYTVDGGESAEVEGDHSFSVSLDGLSPGEHRLEYYGIDRHGVSGDPVRMTFSVIGAAPSMSLVGYAPSEGETVLPFEQALELEPEVWKSLNGRASFPNGADTLTCTIDGGEEKNVSLKSDPSGDKLFSIPLKDILPGYHTLYFHSLDKAGLTADGEFFFIIKGEGGSRLRYADGRFGPSGSLKGSYLSMEKEDLVTFYWEGADKPSTAEVSGEAPFLEASVKDSRVLLKSHGTGIAGDVTINVVTKQGREQILGPYKVIADSGKPKISLSLAKDGIFSTGGFTLAGTAADDTSVEELTVSLNGGRAESLEITDGAFEKALPLNGTADGNIVLTLTARDGRGRTSQEYYLFRKLAAPPEIIQLSPLEERGANGSVTFIGRVKNAENLFSVEYAADGIHYALLEKTPFVKVTLDLTAPNESPADEPALIRLTDLAGNVTLYNPRVLVDTQGDKPVTYIQIPRDGSLVQSDFLVSGMSFDDDEVASLQYRIDGGDLQDLAGANSFEIPFALADLEENEHFLEVRGIDINGVEGDWSGLTFRVSHGEPSSLMEQPVIGESVRGVVEIKGNTVDANGVEKAYVSFDNGISYDLMERVLPQADDTVFEWNYPFNTNQLEDGNHSVLIKGVDHYGVEGLYTSLLTVDNTAPSLEIRSPREGMDFTGKVELEGFLSDNDELASAYVEIEPLGKPEDVTVRDLSLNRLLRGTLALDDLPVGWVNLRFSAVDKTGNVTHASRNIHKVEELSDRRITILTPSGGSEVNGSLLVQGMIENIDAVESVALVLDGSPRGDGEYKSSGFFSAFLGAEDLTEGTHEILATVRTAEGEELSSSVSAFEYRKTGPWIRLDEYSAGDYAANRPLLTGTAGYDYIEPSLDEKELKAFIKEKAVVKVEISIDNGRTFEEVKGREEWKYRLETRETGDGTLWIILRARFQDGETALAKTVLVVDDTPPRVDLLSPEEGTRYNDQVSFAGTAGDENGLVSVQAALREGDKNHYQVPAFIQGLFLDFHFFGSTFVEAGVGLTFFDDNVKLQVLGGTAPEGRFSGTVLGLKLLANVASLPWEYFLGYDFEPFSSSFAVGTTFQYFTMDGGGSGGDSSGIVLGAMLAQAELVKFDLPERKLFSSFSLYTELQLWVISSDVDAGVSPRLSFGIRTDVF